MKNLLMQSNAAKSTLEHPADAQLTLSDLARRSKEAHLACQASMNTCLENALEAGRLLLEAKRLCPHGTWTSWLKEHFGASDRTAQGYMKLARNGPTLGANPQLFADLGVGDALKLLATPKNLRLDVAPANNPSSEPMALPPTGQPTSHVLPTLCPDFSYIAMGEGDSMAVIDPCPDSPGYYYVSVLSDLNAADPKVSCNMRGFKDDPGRIQRALDSFGFVQVGGWIAQPATGETPPWIPSEQERWAIEQQRREFEDVHGFLPELGATAADCQLG